MLNGRLWNFKFREGSFPPLSGYCGRDQADNSLLCSEYEIATHWAPQNWCKSCMRPTTYHCRFKLSTRLQKTNLIYSNLWAPLPFLCLIKILVTWVTIRILAFLEPELILCSFTPLQYLHHSQFQYNNILKYLFKMNLWPQIEVTHYHSHLNNQRDIPAANHPNCHDIFIISSIFPARRSLPKLTDNNKNIWAITENKTINCKNIYCVLGLAGS